jgi:nitroreductase/NAD-dependent dihydropyrimidine dehydrogenase PreA subunit
MDEKMSLINVDAEKCVACDHCVKECPVRIVVRKPEAKVPSAHPILKDWCIDCGHCVAVCPHAALSLHNLTPEECLPVQKELMVSPESFEYFVRARRSIRTFQKQPVEKELLARLIDVARHAPTGSNRQLPRWVVVESAEKVHELSGMVIDWMRYMLTAKPEMAELMGMQVMIQRWESGDDVICRNAPHMIIGHASKEIGTPAADVHIALGTLELAAFSHGLGGCWGGYMDTAINSWPPLREALAIPEGNSSFGVMMLGRPQYEYHRLPKRHPAQVEWF